MYAAPWPTLVQQGPATEHDTQRHNWFVIYRIRLPYKNKNFGYKKLWFGYKTVVFGYIFHTFPIGWPIFPILDVTVI